MGKYKRIEIDIETTADVYLKDVIDSIDTKDLVEELLSRTDVDYGDRIKLSDKFTLFESDGIHSWSVYDQMKINVLKEAYSKYNLNQLEEKLK